jgi:hypothetical protein
MSNTIIFRVEKNGNFFEDLEIKNAKGMQPFIWSIFSKKILGDKNLWITSIKQSRKIWQYWKDKDCTEAEAFAILSTFDKAFVEGHLFKEAAEKLRQFLKESKPSPNEPNSIPEIINYLEKKAEAGYHGMCLHHNTMTPNPWPIKYNFLTNEEHFGIFASIKNKSDLVPPEKFSKTKFIKKEENNEAE